MAFQAKDPEPPETEVRLILRRDLSSGEMVLLHHDGLYDHSAKPVGDRIKAMLRPLVGES